jgi:hypothetical protein
MARTKNQDIPPELAAAYSSTLGPTHPVAYPGGQHAGLNDSIQKHYPLSLEPPHVPTEAQMRERKYFIDVLKCFNEATQNERTAYWRLSRAGAIPYYNDYMRKNIPLRIEGFECPYWAAPYARSFVSLQGNIWGRFELHLFDTEEHELSLALELDNIIKGPSPPDPPTPDAPYGLVHYWWDWGSFLWRTEELKTWDPAARGDYEESFIIPEITDAYPVFRNLFFTRNGATEEGEAVIWDYDPGTTEFTLGLWNFD